METKFRTLFAAGLAIIFLAGIALSYGKIIQNGGQYDDSYITYRYAVNLAEGHGLTFNHYERVNSASSFLYASVLALAYRLGLHDLERVAVALNAAAGSVALTLAFYVAFGRSGSLWVSFLALLPVALSGAWAGWAASGMETVFYGFLIVLCLWSLATGRHAFGAVASVGCLLCRPEGILVWISVLIAAWLSGEKSRIALPLYVISGIATLVALYLFYQLYYGEWVPHAVQMKNIVRYYSPGFGVQIAGVTEFFFARFGALTTAAVVAGALYVARWRSQPAADRSGKASQVGPFVAAVLALTAVAVALGPRSDLTRYAVPVLPLLGIAASGIYPTLRTRLPRRRCIAVLIALSAISMVQAVADARATRAVFQQWSTHQVARKSLGRWIEANVGGRGLILSSDLGAIAYEAKSHDFYDMLGLLTKAPIAAAERNEWKRVVGDLERLAPEYVCDTVTPDGRIQSLSALWEPDRFFRNVTRPSPQPGPTSVTIVRSEVSGPYRFVVAKLLW